MERSLRPALLPPVLSGRSHVNSWMLLWLLAKMLPHTQTFQMAQSIDELIAEWLLPSVGRHGSLGQLSLGGNPAPHPFSHCLLSLLGHHEVSIFAPPCPSAMMSLPWSPITLGWTLSWKKPSLFHLCVSGILTQQRKGDEYTHSADLSMRGGVIF